MLSTLLARLSSARRDNSQAVNEQRLNWRGPMLTDAALRERQWIGLNGLRSLLEEEYSEFEIGGYRTSDSASSLDEVG